MSEELMTPALRARLRDLRLVPRRAAGAHGLGQHSSRSRGVGLEFAQYRAYAPGDEPRRVDWKLYARSDRYFVRESERDLDRVGRAAGDRTSSAGGRGDEAEVDGESRTTSVPPTARVCDVMSADERESVGVSEEVPLI